ncbi:hypothetical protein M9H77_31470 [Catharanthus roseus]|uniref:Uncharacterized protein n=1 Tax=Catharanthus roseus TaxID=4058 RepID=A0ACC0A077_CATRO|nr:hypothetical protein M9H77_31470 [Catharanthus roseus]
MICNNLSESFNSCIFNARDQPITAMLETIMIRELLDKNVVKSRQWKPTWNGIDEYQVAGPKNMQFVVELGLRQDVNPNDYVNVCYSTKTFLKLYVNILESINRESLWPDGESMDLDPSKTFNKPGRPKKARKKQIGENEEGRTRLRRRIVTDCTRCKKSGHYKKGCKVMHDTQPTQEPAPATENQSTQQPAQAKKRRKSSLEKKEGVRGAGAGKKC